MSLYSKTVSRFLFPLHERLKKHETVAIRDALETSQWFSTERLRTLQAERLSSLLESVSVHVAYYAELFRTLGVDPRDFRSLDALALLPTVDKATIRANAGRWTARGSTGLTRQQTSGSSGEPLHFLLSPRRISFDIAAKWRATRWWGVDIGDPEVVLWGSPLETANQDRVRQVRDTLFRSRLIPARDLAAQRIDEILAEIRAFRPRMLFGYPSALARLAFRAQDKGCRMDDLGVRVAFCTSEILRPEWRSAIATTFGCGVANEYGARDAGFVARECPAGGLHITAEEVIVEVVDETGCAVPPGEEGDIVVTNLTGPEFPFIRYRTGDRGALSTQTCSCGRGLPLLATLSGRSNDGLVSATRGWIHGSAINHALREVPGLQAYRVIQESLHGVRILVSLQGVLPKAVSDALSHHVRTLLGNEVQVTVEQVAEIPAWANGKFRHIVCLVDEPLRQHAAATACGADA